MTIESREQRWFVYGLLIWVILHLLWVFTENINGDEFILLARAKDTYLSGQVQGGGRPGLGSVLLVPFVRDCVNAIHSARAARLAWTAFGVMILTGTWLTLRRLFSGRRFSREDALVGVALVGLTPAFLRYSIQVRTDTPAVGFGMVGAAALLASRSSHRWATVSGVLLGFGYMFSQKLLYVGTLAVLLAAGDIVLNDRFRPKREAQRVLLAGMGFLGTTVVLRLLISALFEPTIAFDLRSQLSDFDYYHEVVGYYFYRLLSVELFPHVIMAILVMFGSIRLARERQRTETSAVVLATLVCALGLAIAWFHAGRFPYFWLTLGLFPAIAVAVAMPVVRKANAKGRATAVWFRLAILGLSFFAALEGIYLSLDSQAIQRESLSFVERNLPSRALGFHPERANLCRYDPDPLPTFVIQTIARKFERHDAADSTARAFKREFERRPIQFIIDSQMLEWFPAEIQSFWATHYVRYSSSVYVPGAHIAALPDSPATIDVIVPGEYQWLPAPGSPSERVLVDGSVVAPGVPVSLVRGRHSVEAESTPASGMIHLTMRDGPVTEAESFYTGFMPSWVWLGLLLTR
jgi:hypothetical protein